MTSSSFGFGNGTYIIYDSFQFDPPKCQRCGSTQIVGRTPHDNQPICSPCADIFNREIAMSKAREWLLLLFFVFKREQRSNVYKRLALLFHPDQGGTNDIMRILNEVKEDLIKGDLYA